MKRDRVWVRDTLEPFLRQHLESRDLIVGIIENVDEAETAIRQPETLALYWGVDSPLTKAGENFKARQILERVASQAILFGVFVGFVVNEADPERKGRAWVAKEADASATVAGEVPPTVFRPAVIDGSIGADSVAQLCLRHPPERHWRAVELVKHDTSVELEFEECPEDRALIQRAFSDCDTIEVKLLQRRRDGETARRVYQVWPRRASKDIIPYIVKTGPAEKMYRELGNASIACRDHTPFTYFPPFAEDRIVTGTSRIALVSNFVDRAILLEDYIATHSPAVAIASLFDGPLRCWQMAYRKERIRVGKYALSEGICRNFSGPYQSAYNAVRRKTPNVPSPKTLLGRLRSGPSRYVKMCMAHGDLHLGNVFIRENSVDPVLIDFNRAGTAPASRDAAELEVSLAFAKAKNIAPLSSEEIAQIFSPPLLNKSVLTRRASPRLLAIEQVRRQISGSTNEMAYREMVAAHCLYFAGKKNPDAYRAAWKLLNA